MGREDGKRDRLYAEARSTIGDFQFDEGVAAVFPDMLRRSVPGYSAIVGMIELLAAEHGRTGSRLYDLGCSLGAATLALRRGMGERPHRLVAVDNAPAMIRRAREHCAGLPIDWVCADIRDVAVADASLVVLNFTLQFIPPQDRLDLLRAIRRGLRPGGILVLSEKIRGDTPDADAMLVALHHAFKRAQGYSDLEISQKRAALERVLLPETLATHRDRCRAAGFATCDPWFQCFNFVSMVVRA